MAASATLQLAGQWDTYRSRFTLHAQVANEQHLCTDVVHSVQSKMPLQCGASNVPHGRALQGATRAC